MNQERGVTEEVRQQRHESRTNQTFKLFIRDLCAMASCSEETAARAAGAALCLLERRLTADGARNLEAQLPLKLRELVSECERPLTGGALEKMSRDEFIERAAAALDCSPDEAERLVRAVFATLRTHISEGESDKIASQLPADLEPLWARPL